MTDASGLPSAEDHHFLVDRDGSGILIEARSTAGKITFGTNAITGYLDDNEFDGSLPINPAIRAALAVDLRTLRSGNSLYDAELAQRLDVRRFPHAYVTLTDTKLADDRYQLHGEVSLHGQTRVASGSVAVESTPDGWLISGCQQFDIRDFDIAVPSVLMLRIFPDVVVHLNLKLRRSGAAAAGSPDGA